MTIFFQTDGETGTPDTNWPGKRLGTSCDADLLFDGWYGISWGAYKKA
jgi:hypothetical protein